MNILGQEGKVPITGKMAEQMFLFIAPINMVLAVIVLFLNSTIQRDYYKDRKLPATFMFMIIAAVDIVFATSDIYRSCVALACSQDHDTSVPAWFVMTYITISYWAYNFSIFANVVLAVIKAIQLAAPFHQLSKSVIVFFMVTAGIFWTGLSISDSVVFASKKNWTDFGCTQHWDVLMDYDFVGSGLALDSDDKVKTLKLVATFEYIIPALIILGSMFIQIAFIYKTIGSRSKSTANEVNLTVFLVSAVYCICNSAYGIFYLAEFSVSESMTMSMEFLMKFTLPLANAALFPIILICRKESLRIRYTGYWNSVLGRSSRRSRSAIQPNQTSTRNGHRYSAVARTEPTPEPECAPEPEIVPERVQSDDE